MIKLFKQLTPTATMNRVSNDQAGRLRDLVRNASSVGDGRADGGDEPAIIVMAGGKGGVGVSTLTVGIATALNSHGLRCIAVDANLRRADVGHLAHAPRDAGHNIADVIAGRASAADAVVQTPIGLSVLPGAWAPDTHTQATPEGAARLLAGLRSLGDRADVLVVDAGSGHDPVLAPLWNAARVVLLISSAEPLSVLGAYAAIKLARANGHVPKIELVASRVGDGGQARQVQSSIGGVCQRFLGDGAPLAGWTPDGDPRSHVELLADRLIKNFGLTPHAGDRQGSILEQRPLHAA